MKTLYKYIIVKGKKTILVNIIYIAIVFLSTILGGKYIEYSVN